ncbi:MAG: sel1 repeat family protein [Polyangiaceae bacterium]|nr:sel1 repeat family protein [Polyangiaceae bacterium]
MRVPSSFLIAIALVAPACGSKDAGSAAASGNASAAESASEAPSAVAMPIEDCRTIPVETCAKQCVEGRSGVSCADAANAFIYGRGVRADPARGAEMARHGCDLGQSAACTNLAWLYSEGKGVARNPRKAAELHERACDQGWMLACTNFGAALLSGDGVDKDVPRAVQLFRRACASKDRRGQLHGCFNLGSQLLADADHPEQHQDAVDFLHRSARAGLGRASFMLVGLHNAGKLLDFDAGRIDYLLREACSHGEPAACADIPWENGEPVGVPRGTHQCEYESVYECRDQCQKGHTGSCIYLASMLYRGDKMEKEPTEAKRLYESACKSGYVSACSELAAVLEIEDPKSAPRVKDLREDSCNRGNPVACSWVARDTKDPSAQIALVEKACRWGAADGCRKLALAETDPARIAWLKRKACRLDNKPDCES